MKKIFTLFIIIIPVICIAQKQGNIWYFGNNAGLDFNYSPPVPLLDGQVCSYLPYTWNEGSSSISDSSGSLLFYTNGEKVWNKNHQLMPNGDNLMGHRSATQSSIIVPQPNSQRYFYVFTNDASENNFLNGLRYSVVDMCLEEEKGDVLPDFKNILLFNYTVEKLICINHSNGIDYWIISHLNNSDAFCSFLLTSSGIMDTVISYTGTVDVNSAGTAGGQMIASSNGLIIAYAKPSAANGFTLLLDFDPLTGIISNEQTLSTLNTEYGVSFSPDNSKLYFSTTGHGEIFQYNLNAGNIAAIINSKSHIVQNAPESWKVMQLGPDGIIYIARGNKTFLSIIEFPDSLCPACNYIDSAIYLGGNYSSWGLPNFIASYNYSNTTYNCNTGIEVLANNSQPILYQNEPNPFDASTVIRYFVPDDITGSVYIVFYDMYGKELKKADITSKGFGSIDANTENLDSGIYAYSLIVNDKVIDTKKMIKNK